MRTQFKTILFVAALCMGASTAGAATLGLPTTDPTITVDDSAVLFDSGELIGIDDVDGDSDGLGAAFITFAAGGAADFVSVLDNFFGDVVASDTVLATGFTDSTVEVQFGGLAGTAASQFGSSALLVIAFQDDLGARTSIFDGLVDGETYLTDISLSAVVPLPASALMLGAGLLGLGALRRRKQ